MDSFTLSRNWFNFSFDNPDLVCPAHTAILFFAIEHCNRLGGKEKFGFPTSMAMEAIGIKKHQTYIKYLNDLVNWGFIKMIQKSTNQYSSNIISLIYALPKKGKALDKALSKHAAKQTESTGQSTGQSKDSILKQENNETNKQENNIINTENWREDFEIYKLQLNLVYESLINNLEFINEQEKFHPGIDIILSLEKSYKNFWGTEAGWKFKKSKKAKDINWKLTLTNAIDLNKVWKPKTSNIPQSESMAEMVERLKQEEKAKLNGKA